MPSDCWRFYPDAGRALEQVARKAGLHMTLLESFVAERRADQWNDVVAIFQRDGASPSHPQRLHRQVPCRDVYDRDAGLLSAGDAPTEDMALLAAAHAELATSRASHAGLDGIEDVLHTVAERQRSLAAAQERQGKALLDGLHALQAASAIAMSEAAAAISALRDSVTQLAARQAVSDASLADAQAERQRLAADLSRLQEERARSITSRLRARFR